MTDDLPDELRPKRAVVFRALQLMRSPECRLSQGARHCLIVLADHARQNGVWAECWPSQRTVAGAMGASRRAVQNWIDELRGAGLVDTLDPNEDHRHLHSTCLYRLYLPEIDVVRTKCAGNANDVRRGAHDIRSSYERPAQVVANDVRTEPLNQEPPREPPREAPTEQVRGPLAPLVGEGRETTQREPDLGPERARELRDLLRAAVKGNRRNATRQAGLPRQIEG